MANRMHNHAGNGGFPEPPHDEPQRLVRVRHAECGADTRVRLPRGLPARVVHRVVCDSCKTSYECDVVEELGLLDASGAIEQAQPKQAQPKVSLPRPRIPQVSLPDLRGGAWRWISALIAAAAVIGILLILQGGDSDSTPGGDAAAGAADVAASGDSQFITEPGFSLALPPGWEQTAA